MRLRRSWMFGAIAAAALLGWGFFHPDFHPDPNAIDPAVRQAIAQAGFRSTQGIRIVRMETVYSAGELTDKIIVEQRIRPADDLFTEKWVRRRGLREETAGLYAGPLAVVRFNREKPPFIGELFPFHFWGSESMSEFRITEIAGFPATLGGRMRATAVYEQRYSNGELKETERRHLQCDVTKLIDATAIHPALAGKAARIECIDKPEESKNLEDRSDPGRLSYAHWYIVDRGWSIPLEGKQTVYFDEVMTWQTRLISFE